MTIPVMSPPRSHVTIATRGSMLALWQANYVAELLKKGGITSNQLIVKTTADRIQDRFLHEIGGKGLFVKELEEALAEGKADLAVHSLKDMPVKLPPNIVTFRMSLWVLTFALSTPKLHPDIRVAEQITYE